MFPAVVTYRNRGALINETFEFKTARAARIWIKEELRWENTVRVKCDVLSIDETGDFE